MIEPDDRKFIAIDRDAFRVTVYRLEPELPDGVSPDWEDRHGLWVREKFYDVAIGAIGYATPKGVHYISSRALDPTWRMPDSEWVPVKLRGKEIPGGSPDNPLVAAFIALGGHREDGVGFHGTRDRLSIGSRASHGCIRMLEEDVLDLYHRVPDGTLVFIY